MPNNLHISKPLTNVALAYIQEESSFVANQVVPPRPVAKSVDRLPQWTRENLFRNSMKKRAAGTRSASTDWEYDWSLTYSIENFALHKPIPIEDLVEMDAPWDLKRDASIFLGQQVLLNRESSFSTALLSTSVWAVDAQGKASSPTGEQFLQFNDAASTPIETLRAKQKARHAATGFKPNTMVMTADVAYTLADHPDIIARLDRGQTTGFAGGSPEEVARILAANLGMKVYIMESVIDSSIEGASISINFLATKKIWIGYLSPSGVVYMPTAIMAFDQTNIGGTNSGTYMREGYVDEEQAYWVEVQAYYDYVVTGSILGCLLYDVIAD